MCQLYGRQVMALSESNKPPVSCPWLHMAHSCCPSLQISGWAQTYGQPRSFIANMVLSTSGAHGHISLSGTVQGTGWSKDSLQVTVGARQREENSAIQTRVSQKTAPLDCLWISMDFDPRAMPGANSGTKSTLTMWLLLWWSLSLGQIWISPSQKTAILTLADLPTAISQSRAQMVPICAVTLSMLWGWSTFERCLWFPQDKENVQLLWLCSSKWVQRQRVNMNVRLPC